jgi:hypothetical protein
MHVWVVGTSTLRKGISKSADRQIGKSAKAIVYNGSYPLRFRPRTGKNRRHFLVGLLRQSVFGRLAGYEDVNDAERLSRDPAMRWVVGERAITGFAASASQMGRNNRRYALE